MDKERQIRLNFLDEAEEYFDKMEFNLLGLGSSLIEAQKVDLVLRAAHSVKGGAAMMGFQPLSRTAHRIEDFLKILRVRYPGQSIDVEIETLLLRSVDALRKIGSLNRQEQDIDETEFAQQIQPIFEQLHHYLGDLEESDENALMAQDDDVDPALLLFEDGVESILADFESAIPTARVQDLPALVSTTAQELIAFGNMANLAAFCQLCQSIDQLSSQINAESIQDLTQKALKAWKRSHSLVLRGKIEKLPSHLEGIEIPGKKTDAMALFEGIVDEVSEIESTPHDFISFDISAEIDVNEINALQSAFEMSSASDLDEITEPTELNSFSSLDRDAIDTESSALPLLDLEKPDISLLQNAFASAEEDVQHPDASVIPSGTDLDAVEKPSSSKEDDFSASDLSNIPLPDQTRALLEGLSQRLNLDASMLYAMIAQQKSKRLGSNSTLKNSASTLDQMVRVPASQLKQFNNLFEQLILNRNSINLKLQQLQSAVQLMEQRINQIEGSNTQLKQWYDRASLEGFLNYGADPRSSLKSAYSKDRDLFDSLEMDRYSDIHIICQAQIETIVQLQEVAADIQLGLSDVHQSVDALNYTTQSMQGNVTRTQMLPFKEVVKRCPRIIRDLNLQHEKQVSLEILGETTLLDRRVSELLNDPLMHLLRNAFDHGIEDAASRVNQGKDPLGKITIQASNQGPYTVITIQDDGAGIPIQKIKDRVVQMGLQRSEVDKIPTSDLFEFIFEPGFSTADKVTELSGRGVGMDVVKTNIEEIQGSIHVASNPGQGTIFTIRIPYTLSILRVAVVEQEGIIFAIPANSIQEMFAFDDQNIVQQQTMQTLNWMDEQLPVIEIERGLPYNCAHQKVRLAGTPTIDQPMAIVVKDSYRTAALKISRFWYEQESTIRPIDSPIPLPTGIISSVVFGDGKVIPLIDPSAIIEPYVQLLNTPQAEIAVKPEIDDMPGTRSILIIDDSINVRRYLAHTLEKAGYAVEQAKDGQEGVDRLMDGLVVDAVVCDIEMPRLDGYGFLEEIKGQYQFEQLPVVMLTSRSNEKHRKIAMNLGATDYFSKPYNEAELLEKLSELTLDTLVQPLASV